MGCREAERGSAVKMSSKVDGQMDEAPLPCIQNTLDGQAGLKSCSLNVGNLR